MASNKQEFFELESFAVVGQTAGRPFPKLTYRNLRQLERKIFPVDLSGKEEIEGDSAYSSLADLPEPVAGAIVEVPRSEVMGVVEAVVAAGIKDLWLHMKTDTPEVLELCQREGINVRTGGCAVMYTQQGFSFHSIHKGLVKLFGKY